MMDLPKDPIIMMSVINQKLRDYYPSLDNLCEDLNVERAALEAIMEAAGFEYNPVANKFW